MATRIGLGSPRHMAMGSGEGSLELELVENCPWRSGRRSIASVRELEAYLAYHQAGGTGKRCVRGHLSLRGEEGTPEVGALEGKEIYLHPAAFGCIMGDEQVLYRPLDAVTLAEVDPASAVSPTPTRECVCCSRCAREMGETMPIGWFSPCMVVPRLRSRECPSELREDPETEDCAVNERVVLRCDKGGKLNATFQTITDLMSETLSLKTQLHMAVWAVREAAEKGDLKLPQQDGAEQREDRVEKPEERDGASGEPARVRPVTPPSDAALVPPTTPLCRREGESSGGVHPPLPPETTTTPTVTMTTAPTEIATAMITHEEIDQPAASSSPVIGLQSAVQATTYYARSRAELQNLCRESRIRPDETLAVWLGRLVVELGSDLLDQEEASFLVRQASWSRGHVTDIDMVAFSVHWPIPIPALVAGAIEQKAHAWHDGRPEHTGAEQLVLAIIGVSYCAWNPRECTLGLTPLQRM
ncbi:uncharacterized protein LOC109286380 [Alligator mississippiensis]|uniref:uncharacterized protein LOC109286380 n=1 Tax=Alligator mississippiensis TaxID=8496 RepID=UPI002877C5E4|nr:uncharacterized protein LOC109286380 [Alligator mississippiensis]XP_059585993.1 uncharacterized protein LOC109286380 [Alligator mississippiensis]XP_059586023.1 uncharacterized protein LOC109286380 [Alligator mississippiensis]XP_059586052.1 uncharacterized protein LOC109286380 [Alligator mississippiensis]XP_059586082.1 uncharacterized protein LOC109286380 [Alligator mississippiensis]